MNTVRYNIGLLQTTSRVLVTCGENERITIEQLWICNNDSSNRTIEMSHIPSGDDAAEANFKLFHANTIKSGQTQVVDTRIYLSPGDKLVASASAASAIVLTAYGRVNR